MRLIIGGAHQGKLQALLAQTGWKPEELLDGQTCSLSEIPVSKGINRLHRLIFRLLGENRDAAAWIGDFLEENPDAVLICDEIGCGIVPIQPMEREYRETVGRICCGLAAKASQVQRVFCGIPMVIKGDRL